MTTDEPTFEDQLRARLRRAVNRTRPVVVPRTTEDVERMSPEDREAYRAAEVEAVEQAREAKREQAERDARAGAADAGAGRNEPRSQPGMRPRREWDGDGDMNAMLRGARRRV